MDQDENMVNEEKVIEDESGEDDIGADWNNVSSSSSSQFNTGNQSDHQQDDFLDMLARSQEQRMNDQRCSIDRMDLIRVNQQSGSTLSPYNSEPNYQDNSMQRSNSGPVESMAGTSYGTVQSTRPTNAQTFSNNAQVEPSSRSNRLINRAATIDRSTTNGNSRNNIVTNGRRGSNPINFGSNNRPTSSSGSASLSSAYGSSGSDLGNARDELLDMIAALQSRRLDEQRAPLSVLRRSLTSTSNGANHSGLSHNNSNSNQGTSTNQGGNATDEDEIDDVDDLSSSPQGQPTGRKTRQMSLGANILPDDDFFEQLMKCQSSRLEDQRVTLPNLFAPQTSSTSPSTSANILAPSTSSLNPSPTSSSSSARANFARNRSATVSDSSAVGPTGPSKPITEDFFGLIMRFQSARIEDQRTELPGGNHSEDGDDENNEGGKKSSGNSTSNSSLTSSYFLKSFSIKINFASTSLCCSNNCQYRQAIISCK